MNPNGETSLSLPMEDPDVRDMLEVQAGSPLAFERLVERHSPALVHYFFFQCRDHDVALDCTQEVWTRIFRSRAEYSPKARFTTFLFRVARNFWIDRYRNAARRPSELSLDREDASDGNRSSFELTAKSTPDPSARLENEETKALVAAAVASLPEDMRDAFLLGEVQAIPYSEVAQILSIPIGTVKSRMFHAVRRLRESLKNRIEFER